MSVNEKQWNAPQYYLYNAPRLFLWPSRALIYKQRLLSSLKKGEWDFMKCYFRIAYTTSTTTTAVYSCLKHGRASTLVWICFGFLYITILCDILLALNTFIILWKRILVIPPTLATHLQCFHPTKLTIQPDEVMWPQWRKLSFKMFSFAFCFILLQTVCGILCI